MADALVCRLMVWDRCGGFEWEGIMLTSLTSVTAQEAVYELGCQQLSSASNTSWSVAVAKLYRLMVQERCGGL